MFIFSVKADKKKICVVLAVILLIVTSAVVLTKLHNSSPTAECAGIKYSLSAATNEERVSFFSQFGWKVETEPIEIKDVLIPEKFDDVYTNYNKIQKDQGLDLTPYAGKACKQWVYTVTNYPQSPDVRGTILVYDNRVIGGDLSTVALDGFMTGFRGEQVSDDMLQQARTSSAPASALPASSAAPASSAGSSSAPKENNKENNKENEENEAKPKASSAIPTNAWPTD